MNRRSLFGTLFAIPAAVSAATRKSVAAPTPVDDPEKDLSELWCSLLSAQTIDAQAAWARKHGLQLIEHACLLSDVDIGYTELLVSPQEALAMYARANPRHPKPFERA